MDLIGQVSESLDTEYDDVNELGGGFFYAQAPKKDRSEARSALIYACGSTDGLRNVADDVVAGFRAHISRYGPDERNLVATRMSGLNASHAKALSTLSVVRQWPIEFHDRFYRFRPDKKGAAAFSLTFARNHRALISDQRVQQRFEVRRGTATRSDDLLDALTGQAEANEARPSLTLVTAPAGAGKTIIFNAFYAWLYERFHAIKQRKKGVFPRPLFFIPEMLATQDEYSFERLMDAVLATDSAMPISGEHLLWLHRNGYVSLMFDGIDEILAQQNDFLEALCGSLAAPDSRAKVVLCMRDGLLDTSEPIRNFLDRLEQTNNCVINEYRLLPWNEDDRKRLFTLRASDWVKQLDKPSPQRNGHFLAAPGLSVGDETRLVAALEASVANTPYLSNLLTNPFYCEVVADAYFSSREFDVPMPSGAFELLDGLLRQMLRREREKLTWRNRTTDGTSNAEAEPDPLDAFFTPRTEELLMGFANTVSSIPHYLSVPGRSDREELRLQALLSLAAAAAHANRRRSTAKTSALAVETLSALLDDTLGGPAHTEAEQRMRALLALKQLAFFGAGGSAGTVDFTHEIIADFLAGRHTASLLVEAVQPQFRFWLLPAGSELLRQPDRLTSILGSATRSPDGVFEGSLRWHLSMSEDNVRLVKRFLARARRDPLVGYLDEIIEPLAGKKRKARGKLRAANA